MAQLDKIINGIDAIENGLTLKADYTNEKHQLDNIYSDLSVMATLGAPRWKVNDAKNRIRNITAWMNEEEAHTNNLPARQAGETENEMKKALTDTFARK